MVTIEGRRLSFRIIIIIIINKLLTRCHLNLKKIFVPLCLFLKKKNKKIVKKCSDNNFCRESNISYILKIYEQNKKHLYILKDKLGIRNMYTKGIIVIIDSYR